MTRTVEKCNHSCVTYINVDNGQHRSKTIENVVDPVNETTFNFVYPGPLKIPIGLLETERDAVDIVIIK